MIEVSRRSLYYNLHLVPRGISGELTFTHIDMSKGSVPLQCEAAVKYHTVAADQLFPLNDLQRGNPYHLRVFFLLCFLLQVSL